MDPFLRLGSFPKSCNEGAGKDSGWEEKEEWGDGDRRRAQGFIKGKGTTNGMFTLRQLLAKGLEVHGEMALGVVDREKADDAVPREMLMATLRRMGMPDAGVGLVEGMLKGTKGRVLVGPEMLEFSVTISLRQGSSQPTHVYHDDGTGKQKSKYERHSGEVICTQSGCSGRE